MSNEIIVIIIEGFHGRIENEYASVYTEGTTKKRIIKDLKEKFQDILDNEYKELNKSISDFEFTIYKDITEKYS